MKSFIYLVHILFALTFLAACTPDHNNYPVRALPESQRQHLKSMAAAGFFLGPLDPVPEQAPTQEEICKMRISSLPANYIHGSLEVPENPANPQGQKISIFYYGHVQADPNLQQDVTIFFNGGPGGDSESSFLRLYQQQLMDSEKHKVNFLYIDQRGTGCSSHYPQGSSKETLLRLSHYGTRGIVADAEKIREHLLGNQKWRVFGQSYGAYIVHKYAIVAPQSIRQAYAHANAITENPVLRHAERIASQDRVLQEYFKSYPEDRQKLIALNQKLETKPCLVVNENKKYCGYTLTAPFVLMLGFPTSWPRLHDWLNKVVLADQSIDMTFLEKIASYYLIEEFPENDQEIAQGVIAYVDRKYYDAEGKLCAKAFAELSARGFHPEQFILNECKDETSIYADGSTGDIDKTDYVALQELPTDWMTAQQLQESLTRYPDLKFNWYSGELDCYVPVANFIEELGVVKSLVSYTHFPTSGHDGFFSEAQVWRDLVSQ